MLYSEIIRKIPVDKGWSADRKFCAMTASGEKYLLRISPMERYERKKQEYDRMTVVSALDIPMCNPLEFGICGDGVYSLQTWIDGKDAEAVMVTLPREAQYAYGYESGQILAKIHSIPAPEDVPDWEAWFNAKIDRKIVMHDNSPVKYENPEPFLNYIARNRHLLANRPQSYQHGDYHIGNMMIDNSGKLTVIDFEKDDFGDPWEEFNRIVWSAQAAPDFARGMVDGYFGGDVPMDFWKLLALYIASNTLGSLPWAVAFGEGEVAVMRRQAADVLAWYENMTNPVPTWYRAKR